MKTTNLENLAKKLIFVTGERERKLNINKRVVIPKALDTAQRCILFYHIAKNLNEGKNKNFSYYDDGSENGNFINQLLTRVFFSPFNFKVLPIVQKGYCMGDAQYSVELEELLEYAKSLADLLTGTISVFVRKTQELFILHEKFTDAVQLGNTTGLGILVEKKWLEEFFNQRFLSEKFFYGSFISSFSNHDIFNTFYRVAATFNVEIPRKSKEILAKKYWDIDKFKEMFAIDGNFDYKIKSSKLKKKFMKYDGWPFLDQLRKSAKKKKEIFFCKWIDGIEYFGPQNSRKTAISLD